MKYAIEKFFSLKGIVSWDVMHTFLFIDSQVVWNCEHFDLWYVTAILTLTLSVDCQVPSSVTVILTLTLSADFQMFWRTTLRGFYLIPPWSIFQILGWPTCPRIVRIRRELPILCYTVDKWWQNTVLYSDTPLQQVLNENVVKIKMNTSKRPNSKLSEIQIDLMRLSLFLGRIQEEQSEQTSLGFYAVCLLKPYCLLVNMVSVV